jgi:hypothetical protein
MVMMQAMEPRSTGGKQQSRIVNRRLDNRKTDRSCLTIHDVCVVVVVCGDVVEGGYRSMRVGQTLLVVRSTYS